MFFRTLGRTNLKVSTIALGTASLGRADWGVRPHQERKLPSRKEAHKFLSAVAEREINFIDTAPNYGRAEKILGEIIKEDASLREHFIIATKCGFRLDAKTNSDIKDFSANWITKSIEKSLKNLGSPIDLMQIHSATMEAVQTGEVLEIMRKFQEKGDIKFLGLTSSWYPDVLKAAIETEEYDTIQTTFNLLTTQSREETFALATEKRMGIIVSRPLASGLLSPSHTYAREEEKEKIQQLSISLSKDVTLLEAAMRFVLSNKHISTVLVGTSKLERLKNIMEVFNHATKNHT